ncbi:MAG: sigma-54 dependent transcriptional regulator [Treponema sp.]|nr:sigma-54 dependent transcriptional regulator [Treponema sp.]
MKDRPPPGFPIVIVDDERYVLDSVESILRAEGLGSVIALDDQSSLLGLLDERPVGVVLLDLVMPGMEGRALLARIRQEHPQTPVVVITGNREIDTAIECMKLGAADYLAKPVEAARLVTTVRRLMEMSELERENLDMRERLLSPPGERPRAFAGIATAGHSMGPILAYAEAIAPSSHPVLVTGETGVGKELFAKAVHDLSGREGEFVAVNVAGLDDAFFSDLLFGHRAGAYTGSQGSLDGLIDKARNGSLFLDEIGDLSNSSQLKLLRVLETGEYYPLGSDLMKRSKARIVVATNRDLDAAMKEGAFRKDLFYRLHSHHLHIPPLRERREDLPVLVQHFLEQSARELGKRRPTPPPELFALLHSYDFPGNVRELRALIFEAVSRHTEGVLSTAVFKEAMGERRRTTAGECVALVFPEPLPSLKTITELLVDEALRRSSGSQSLAAQLLGVSPQAVSKRLKSRQSKADNRG